MYAILALNLCLQLSWSLLPLAILKLLFLGASVGYHCVTIQHTYKMKVTDGHHILPKKMNCMTNMHASRKILVQNKVA